MECTILGCGASNGVPQISCNCTVCTSDDPKNKRLRPSIIIKSSNTKILIDTSPDLRQQAITNKINHVDAILYTHDHSDHVSGIDDTKFLSKDTNPIPAYMNQETHHSLKNRFRYIFEQLTPLYKPRLEAKVFDGTKAFYVNEIKIQPFIQLHRKITSMGYRFGNLAYSTDVDFVPEESFKILEGVKIWIVDCLRYYWAPSHSYLEKTLEWISRIKPEIAILTHMAHEMDYNEISKILPENVKPAYDGMRITF